MSAVALDVERYVVLDFALQLLLAVLPSLLHPLVQRQKGLVAVHLQWMR